MKLSVLDHGDTRTKGLGLCPDPNTIIEEHGLLIFIGPRSNPKHDFNQIGVMDAYGVSA